MVDLPLVSVICPSYNSKEFIGDTIESVLNQTYKNIEIIVVDDGSTDGTIDYLENFEGKIQLCKGSHHGACSARNIGAKIAKGRFLLFLDSDDLLKEDTIELLTKRAIQLGRGNLIGSSWKRLHQQDDTWQMAPSGLNESPPNLDFIKGWISGWYIPPAGILWHIADFEQTGGWDESLTANQDGDLILRALLNGLKISIVKEAEVYYRFHGANKTSISNLRSIDKLESRIKVLKKVEDQLKENGELEKYALEIGKIYHNLARNHYRISVELAEYCNNKGLKLAGSKSINGTFSHKMLTKLFGLKIKENLAHNFSSIGIKNAKRNLSEMIMKNKLDDK